jgi:hypothetical protein
LPDPPRAAEKTRGRPKSAKTLEQEHLANAYPCLHGDRLTKDGSNDRLGPPDDTLDIELAEIRDGIDFAHILEDQARANQDLFRVKFYADTSGSNKTTGSPPPTRRSCLFTKLR